MAAQQEIAFAWNASQVGQRLDVMIDRCISSEQNAYVGRSWADAPEVDGQVYVTGENLTPGQIVPCEIVAAKDYDLIGVRFGVSGPGASGQKNESISDPRSPIPDLWPLTPDPL